jgi:hypothetical protein
MIADKGIVVATVPYQSGVEWPRALAIVSEFIMSILAAPCEPDQIQAVGGTCAKCSSYFL